MGLVVVVWDMPLKVTVNVPVAPVQGLTPGWLKVPPKWTVSTTGLAALAAGAATISSASPTLQTSMPSRPGLRPRPLLVDPAPRDRGRRNLCSDIAIPRSMLGV